MGVGVGLSVAVGIDVAVGIGIAVGIGDWGVTIGATEASTEGLALGDAAEPQAPSASAVTNEADITRAWRDGPFID